MKLVFLGPLVDRVGHGELTMDAGRADWSGIMAWIGDTAGPEAAAAIASPKVKVAVNGSVLGDRTALAAQAGDEIAFLPPVSGG